MGRSIEGRRKGILEGSLEVEVWEPQEGARPGLSGLEVEKRTVMKHHGPVSCRMSLVSIDLVWLLGQTDRVLRAHSPRQGQSCRARPGSMPGHLVSSASLKGPVSCPA